MYTYHDFELAYYSNRVYECKEIGLQLLERIKTKEAEKYHKKLEKVEWDWNLTQKEHKEIARLLSDIKIYLMVNL